MGRRRLRCGRDTCLALVAVAQTVPRVTRMSFDRLAPYYRLMEFFLAGNKLQRCRTCHLNSINPPKNALLLGEGNGRFLSECLRLFPKARFTCLDSSSRMLSLTRQRLEKIGLDTSQVEFVHADALVWNAQEKSHDLIVTLFFLDCFQKEQLEKLVAKLAKFATDQSFWLLADFQVPESGVARVRAKIIHQLMYGFFRFATRLPASSLTPPKDFLEHHGFQLKKRIQSEFGLLHSDLWQRG